MLFITQKKPRHRRYQPPTLYQQAFNKTCFSLWKLSLLPSLHAECAYNYKKECLEEENEDYKEYLMKVCAVLNNIEKNTLCSSGKVPFAVRMKIMNVIKEIDNDMREFAFAVAHGLNKKTIPRIKYCMEHIAVTNNFTIDMTESICNILLVSKLSVDFTQKFLVHYCVKPGNLLKVCEHVCKKKKVRRSNAVCDVAMKKLAHDPLPAIVYWKKQRRQDRLDSTRENLRYASDFQYVAAVGPLDALKYYYDVTCQKLEKNEKDLHVYQCATFMFKADAFTAEKIQFFHKKMSTEKWNDLLNKEFVNIFQTYLRSWRHRHLCVQLFTEIIDTVDIVTIQVLLRGIAFIAREKYQYLETMAVIKELWNFIPASLKTDFSIIATIPDLMPAEKDIDDSVTNIFLQSLTHFLEDYVVEVKEEIIARIIFKLVSTSKENHIKACLETAQQLGLETKAGKEYLTKDRLKNLLVHDAATSVQTDYEKVSKYVTSNEKEENKLKEELIQDKHFITDLLESINVSLTPFLEWALKEASKINTYKATLITECLMDDIYQRRLIQSPTFCDANKIFSDAMLNLSKQQIIEIQSRVKDNAKVLHQVLLKSMGSIWFNSSNFFATLSFTEEEENGLMREFLYLPETKEAIYDMILDLQKFVSSFMCPCDGAQLMLQWHRFIKNMVIPYVDGNAYEAMLLQDRETVMSGCLEKVKNIPYICARYSDYTIRMIIDLRLRGFSLLFLKQELHYKLQKYMRYPIAMDEPFMFRVAMEMGPF